MPVPEQIARPADQQQSADQPYASSARTALPAPETHAALPAPGADLAPAPARSSRGSLLRKIGLVVLLVAVGILVYYKLQANKTEAASTASKTAAAANRPVPVTVAAVQSRTMPIYFTALGTVTAYNTVTVKSRVDGQLLSVNVREGQQVHQGQVLAMIDPRPYNAVVAQAEGQLAKDEAAAENARAEAGRYTALYQAGVVSKESQQVQVSTAGQSVGTLAADRAAIQAAKVNVAYTRITSPINGVVGLRQVDAGNIVHASDATGLLLVTQLQPIAVVFTLPEDQLPEVLKLVRSGHKLVVEAYDRSEATHLASGSLLTVDNQIDTTTGTVKAKAVFDNRDGALFPNQFVNVRLILDQRANSLVIPASALQTGTAGSFVYVVRPGEPPQHAEDKSAAGPGAAAGGKNQAAAASGGAGGGADQSKTPPYWVDVAPVDVDLTEGSQIILKSGVNAGDQVVIDGQEKLRRYGRVIPRSGAPGARRGGSANSSGTPGTAGSASATPGGQAGGKGAAADSTGNAAEPQPAPATTPEPGRRQRNQNSGDPSGQSNGAPSGNGGNRP